MPKITIYSTPTCVYCKMAKSYFQLNKVEYEEKNVAADQVALKEMMQKSGQLGVPVIDVDGQIVVGFDKPTLAKLIGTQENK